LLTAVGVIELERVYFGCPGCGLGDFGADRVLGVDGSRTPRARRMACLAGVEQSFDRAARLLDELAGWRLDGETVRRLCHAEAARAAAWQAAAEQPARRLAQAPGDWELHVDAGKVNTTGGWRDVKVGVFARRVPGEPATAAEWASRELPPPEARLVWAAVEEAALFGPRLRAQAGRLGLTEAKDLTVLGDGADWIWQLAQTQFAGAAGALDIFHACEHLAAAGKRVFGEGTAGAAAWLETSRQRLLADGWPGLLDALGGLLSEADTAERHAAKDELVSYFAKQTTRLNYAWRLATGRSIGSGLVEGTIKQVVVRRLKQTGAQWRVEHVGPFAQLCALAQGPDWAGYWTAA
jgi:hypothetical protein